MMKEAYYVNLRTGTLHIHGYCRQTQRNPYDIRYFLTAEEARAELGRALEMCKACRKRLEREETTRE